MSIKPYQLEVDGIGEFTFRRRNMRDQIRIEAEAERITGGPVENKSPLQRAAIAIATLSVLTVKAPDGWDVDAMDPLEQADVETVLKVAGEVYEAEARFRERAKQ